MSKTSVPPIHGGLRKPWRKWMDGKWHVARAGKHFDLGKDEGFARAARKYAAKHGWTCNIESRGPKPKTVVRVRFIAGKRR